MSEPRLTALLLFHLRCIPGNHDDCPFCKKLAEWEEQRASIAAWLETDGV